jgi:hypothetical protein
MSRAGGWQPFKRPRRSKLLGGLDDWPRQRFRRHRGNADVVRQELVAETGIVASLRAVEPCRQELLAESQATLRFETTRGRQLQIDFGERLVEIAGARSRSSCSSRRSITRTGCTCGCFAMSARSWFDGMEARRAGLTAWRAPF